MKKISALLIDDEEEILKTLERYLTVFTELDLNILTATTFNQAIEIINSERPVITVSDISLPDGDGLDIIREARKTSHANQVIMMTGFSNVERVIKALDNGACDFLCKPLNMDEFESVFKEAIQRYYRWYKLFSETLKGKNK